MPSLNDLRAEVSEKLSIKVARIEAPSGTIDVGDEFRVVFRIMNRFGLAKDLRPFESAARYLDVALDVKGTQFTEVVGGDRTIPVIECLPAGQVADVDVRLAATARFPDLGFAPEIDIREPFVQYRLHGRFDIEQFFHIERTGKASGQIRT
jgi:hypothetical protein